MKNLTYTHMYIHRHTHTHICTYTHICMCVYIYTQTCLLPNDLDKITLGQLNSYRFVKPKESLPIILIIYKDNSRCIRSDQISHSVVSDSLRPHESQHARPPCPSATPRVHSDSRPSSQ